MAQDAPRWVVIGSSAASEDLEDLGHLRELASAALEATGARTLSAERAASLLDATRSVPFEAAPLELNTRLSDVAARVLEDVAFGREARALEVGSALLAELEGYLPSLGSSPDSARDLGHLCLYVARAHLQQQDEDAARAAAERCLRLVPDLTADPTIHPPAVCALVAQLRADTEAAGGATLSVRTYGRGADACVVRIQGRPFGRSAALDVALVPGTFHVHVECGAEQGWVRTVDVSASETARVAIHLGLDEAIRSSRGPLLRYSDADELDARLPAHVAALADLLRVDSVLAVVATAQGAQLRAFSVDAGEARLVGRAALAADSTPASDEAVRAALSESERALALPLAAAAPGAPASPSAAGAHEEDLTSLVVGSSLAALGAASYALTWFFWDALEAEGRAMNGLDAPEGLADAQRRYDLARAPVAALGGVGAALASLAMPLLLPPEAAVPWWSWTLGALGLGVSAIGIWQLTETGECYGASALGADCVRRSERGLLGTLILEHAAPLLSIPLTHLVRLVAGPTTSATLSLDGSGSVAVSIGGAL